MRLLEHVGKPVRVSTLLLEVAAFALDLAQQTHGAFDPTIGAQLERLGFNVHYKTGQEARSAVDRDNARLPDVWPARAEGHILDARTRRSVSALASVTVVAPTAMAADGLSTAAMVLGPERGPRLLEDQAVSGLFIAPDGAQTSVDL